MKWQDAVFAIGSVAFSVALVPSVIQNDPPSASTAALTAAVLTTYPVVLGTLRLRWAAATTSVSAALWWVLLAQAVA